MHANTEDIIISTHQSISVDKITLTIQRMNPQARLQDATGIYFYTMDSKNNNTSTAHGFIFL